MQSIGANMRAAKLMGSMPHYRDGGMVKGKGSPTSDNVTAKLSPGEVVLPVDTVKAVGAAQLMALIDTTHTPSGKPAVKDGVQAKADGGLVEDKTQNPFTQVKAPNRFEPAGGGMIQYGQQGNQSSSPGAGGGRGSVNPPIDAVKVMNQPPGGAPSATANPYGGANAARVQTNEPAMSAPFQATKQPSPASSAAQVMASPVNFDATTKTYSGSNIGPGAEILGGRGGGGVISAQGQTAAQRLSDLSAAESLARVTQSTASNPAQQPLGVSLQKDPWSAQKALDNAATAASSIHAPTAARGAAELAFLQNRQMQAEREDASTGRTAMTDFGQTARARMAELGQTARANASNALTAGLTQFRDQGETQRTLLKEAGDDRRALLSASNRMQGAPAGYQWAPDGRSLQPIPGGPASLDKPTEDQAKARGWLAQAQSARQNMIDAAAAKKGADTPGFGDAVASLPGLASVGNYIMSPERQKYNQAASSFAEAALRAATGAGVNKDEALQKIAELTPRMGDSKEVRDQKYATQEVYLKALEARSGLRQQEPQPQAVPQAVAPVVAPTTASPTPQVQAPASAAPAQQVDPGHLSELQRRAASNPAIAAALKQMGY
ncbi:hypothetical protein PSQ40_04970 [Curvibacter sp. HBC61]|uniref:Uncharacterized protein n=1 Tax=Curvibacter cyanobacteriorum TaxID=3026422 RepID=A0ABT5MV39_9BURK|nr:hypothetical protein [Curvibacter sp. HBC61]MDD0837918.1 hypothetical protein [Curvibacter sp. HBC61]